MACVKLIDYLNFYQPQFALFYYGKKSFKLVTVQIGLLFVNMVNIMSPESGGSKDKIYIYPTLSEPSAGIVVGVLLLRWVYFN